MCLPINLTNFDFEYLKRHIGWDAMFTVTQGEIYDALDQRDRRLQRALKAQGLTGVKLCNDCDLRNWIESLTATDVQKRQLFAVMDG